MVKLTIRIILVRECCKLTTILVDFRIGVLDSVCEGGHIGVKSEMGKCIYDIMPT